MGILSDMLVNWGFRDPALVDGDIAPEQLNEPKVAQRTQEGSFAQEQQALIQEAGLNDETKALLDGIFANSLLKCG